MVWGGGALGPAARWLGGTMSSIQLRGLGEHGTKLWLCTSQKPESTWASCFCHTTKAGFSVFGYKRQMLQEESFDEKAPIRVQGIVMKNAKKSSLEHHQ